MGWETGLGLPPPSCRGSGFGLRSQRGVLTRPRPRPAPLGVGGEPGRVFRGQRWPECRAVLGHGALVVRPDELQAALTDKGEPGTAAGTDPGEPQRPPYSSVALIAMAIRDSAEQRLSLSDICAWFSERCPHHSCDRRSWMDCVRHTLSTNPCFQRLPRGDGTGSDWTLHPDLLHFLRDCDPRRDLPKGQSRRRRRLPSALQPPQPPPAPAPAPAPPPAPHAVPASPLRLLLLSPRCPNESWTVRELPEEIPPDLLEALGLKPGELCRAPDPQ